MQEIIVTDTWRDRIEDLLARTRENRLLLVIVGAVVAVSMLMWSRGPSARVAPPARAASAPFVTPSATTLTSVIVHVAGAVRRPGLYEFPSGARIADAIETAGGALRSADLDVINLAEPLVDGIQVLIPQRTNDAELGARAGAPSAATPTPALVPLNSADVAALETIPGVGPVTALAIVDHRTRVGSFTSVDELLDVDGIGPATLEAIRPYVSL